MTPEIGIPVAGLALGLAGWGLWRTARTYLRFRGRRVVACPETGQPAAVELASWRTAVRAAFERPAPRLRACSRWPGRALCDQACLPRIAAAPEEFLVVTIVSRWYQGKTCVCCGKPLGRITPWAHRPCLLSPDREISEWKDIPAENIPRVLATHAPVCWTCLVAETHTL
jgi:hypothetical protein